MNPLEKNWLNDLRADGTAIDVVGIGNALVDVLSHEAEEFVGSNDLTKGSMTLIETERATDLYDAMGSGIEVSGGSAANTIAGVASFGGRAAFLGKVFDDQLGQVFAHDMRANGVLYRSPLTTDGAPTGRCLIIVTPDAERTMNTYLGASADFGPDDLDEELIASARITYLEGYLFDRPEARAAYRKASEIAHSSGRQVALTLSDTFCVTRHLDEWKSLVADDVDILFANEGELETLYDTGIHQAIDKVRNEVDLACITLGPKGSILIRGEETVEVPAHQVPKVVDTTGAGDLYASGVLHGLSQSMSLAEAGRMGSIAASAVIGHTGARPGQSLAQLA